MVEVVPRLEQESLDVDRHAQVLRPRRFLRSASPCYIVEAPIADDGVDAWIAELERLDDVNIVVAPDLWADAGSAPATAAALARHCAAMGNRMALLHTPQSLDVDGAAGVPAALHLDDVARQFTAIYCG